MTDFVPCGRRFGVASEYGGELGRYCIGNDLCPHCREIERLASRIRSLRELVEQCQDWLCAGGLDINDHTAAMGIINRTLDTADAGEGE